MSKIELNFIELTPKDFSVIIYRKEYKSGSKQANDYIQSLPTSNEEFEERKNYYIYFDSNEESEKFEFQSHSNHFVAEKMILDALQKKLSLLSINYQIYETQFNKTIEIILEEIVGGKKLITLIPYYLKSENKLGLLVDYRFENDGTLERIDVLKHSLALDKNGQSNRRNYFDKYKIIQSFIRNIIIKIKNLQIGSIDINISNTLTQLDSYILEKKRYVFAKKNISSSQFLGIKNFGVYKNIEKDVRYFFLFKEDLRGFANQLFLGLQGRTYPETFPGMDKLFHLDFSIDQIDSYFLKNESIHEVTGSLKKIDDFISRNSSKKVIVVFIETKRDDNLKGKQSPYYFLKYELIKRNIPLQVIDFSKISKSSTLKWSLSNIGLQIFSKLGGIPWIVYPKNNKCLILGIGTSHQKDEIGKVKRYFSYTICLDSSGIYKKMQILSEDENEESYLTNLKENLISLLKTDEYKEFEKCVLHIPFKIKKTEIESIKQALKEVKDIEFRVLKINLNSKFFGFGSHQTKVPYESSYSKISNHEYIVWFQGLQQGKELVSERISNPVHIEFLFLENTKKFNDKDYLQDAINLSGANWRGFNAKLEPISTYYADLVAKFTVEFEKFDDFDKRIFDLNEPWFL